ncbi:hypothetical protein C6P40_002835 [Pichia californica]|uniref:GYF domain-containing protein n=1 Tax=Pichia californica TaxID=460514 RepID=A0A9P6WNY4_9ASCO|nr:hypothetical protein C6P42_004479 [[Candida] californica]KAG0690460.1 hypothetical protein C6P40_002835 [[Candida] californica]
MSNNHLENPSNWLDNILENAQQHLQQQQQDPSSTSNLSESINGNTNTDTKTSVESQSTLPSLSSSTSMSYSTDQLLEVYNSMLSSNQLHIDPNASLSNSARTSSLKNPISVDLLNEEIDSLNKNKLSFENPSIISNIGNTSSNLDSSIETSKSTFNPLSSSRLGNTIGISAGSASSVGSPGTYIGISQIPPGLSVQQSLESSQWYYQDLQGIQQGPFDSNLMQQWYLSGLLVSNLMIRKDNETIWSSISDLWEACKSSPNFNPDLAPFNQRISTAATSTILAAASATTTSNNPLSSFNSTLNFFGNNTNNNTPTSSQFFNNWNNDNSTTKATNNDSSNSTNANTPNSSQIPLDSRSNSNFNSTFNNLNSINQFNNMNFNSLGGLNMSNFGMINNPMNMNTFNNNTNNTNNNNNNNTTTNNNNNNQFNNQFNSNSVGMNGLNLDMNMNMNLNQLDMNHLNQLNHFNQLNPLNNMNMINPLNSINMNNLNSMNSLNSMMVNTGLGSRSNSNMNDIITPTHTTNSNSQLTSTQPISASTNSISMDLNNDLNVSTINNTNKNSKIDSQNLFNLTNELHTNSIPNNLSTASETITTEDTPISQIASNIDVIPNVNGTILNENHEKLVESEQKLKQHLKEVEEEKKKELKLKSFLKEEAEKNERKLAEQKRKEIEESQKKAVLEANKLEEHMKLLELENKKNLKQKQKIKQQEQQLKVAAVVAAEAAAAKEEINKISIPKIETKKSTNSDIAPWASVSQTIKPSKTLEEIKEEEKLKREKELKERRRIEENDRLLASRLALEDLPTTISANGKKTIISLNALNNSKSNNNVLSNSAWATTGASQILPTKSIDEIQQEELEAVRKHEEASAAARAQKTIAESILNQQKTFASSIASENSVSDNAWTIVSKKVKPVTPISSSSVSSPSVKVNPTLLRSVSTPIPQSTNSINNKTYIAPSVAKVNSINFPPPVIEFLGWARNQLNGLYPSVNKEDVLQIMMQLPSGSETQEIIADTIYSNSSTMDGRRFASEFMKKRSKIEETIRKHSWAFDWFEALEGTKHLKISSSSSSSGNVDSNNSASDDWDGAFTVVKNKKNRKGN